MKNYRLLIVIAVVFLLAISVIYAAGDKNATPVDARAIGENNSQVVSLTETEPLADQPGEANKSAGEEINWQVTSSGGDIGGSSPSFLLGGTIGQTATGTGSSDNFGLNHGFWQEFEEDVCDCLPGDANGDGQVNVGDAVYIIAYVFKGGPAPIPYPICSGDANCDCQCNVGDAVYVISYVFKGGPAPCECEAWRDACGELH